MAALFTRLTFMSHRRIIGLSTTCVLLTLACGETIDPTPGGFSDSASFSAADGTSTGHLDVGPGELGPGECVADAKQGVWGYQYQCGGYFMARVGATHDGDPYEIWIPKLAHTYFGDGHEPYPEAKVIACCGLTDTSLSIWDQPPAYGENCLLDFRQQACTSIATGLATLINDGTVPNVIKDKATDVQHYLAEHGDECISALMFDQDDNPIYLEEARWNLPDEGPWAPQLSDVFVEIKFAIITDLYLPDEPATCVDLSDNDGAVFTPPEAPLINVLDVDLDEGGGGIVGPGRISATAPFASLSTDCIDRYCSIATFSTAADKFAIDRMLFYVDGDLRVTNGTDSESISNVRVELYDQAIGSITGGGRAPTVHTIAAGQAQFLVVGHAAGEWVTIPVLTTTPIVAHETGGTWSLDAFALEYVDDMGETWTLRVDASQWL